MQTIFRKIFRDKDDIWVALNLGVRFSSRMITIGLLVHYLSVDEVASWYIFAAMFGLVSLAEAGLGRVTTRQVAERFLNQHDKVVKKVDFIFLSSIFKLYTYLLIFICGLGFIVGLWWLKGSVDANNVPFLNIAWAAFVVANGIGLYSALHTAVLSGLGNISISQKNEIVSNLCNLFVFLLTAYFSQTLLAPTLALLVSTSVSFLLNRASLHRLVPKLRYSFVGLNINYSKALLTRITPELGKYFFMLLAFHLLTSAFILMLSHYEDAQMVASYGITMQLITLVLTFSNIWLTSSFPKMAALKGYKSVLPLRKLFFSWAFRSVSLVLLGLLSILFIANSGLNIIDSKVSVLPDNILHIVIVSVFIEYTLSTMAQLLISQSILGFSYYSSIGAIVIAIVSFFLFQLGYGLIEVYEFRIALYVTIIGIPIMIGFNKIIFKDRVNN